MGVEISLEGRRVAVTGAGGFIGNAVCVRLTGLGADVTGIDAAPDASEKIQASGAEPVTADITDAAAMRKALAGSDLLVNAAAIVSDAGAMADHIRVNVGGAATTLAAAAAEGVERSLHVSSVVVYGFDDPTEQDETAHLRNCGVPYIDTKSASDALARKRGAVVIRPGDVYGPGSVPWAIRPLELAQAGRLAVPGDGKGAMLAIYIDDLVEAVILGLIRGEPGEAYATWNDEDPVTFEQFFARFAEMARGTPVRRLPRPVLRAAGLAGELSARISGGRPSMTRHSAVLIDRKGIVSTKKAREGLGWAPKVSFDEGMGRTEAWLREASLL